VEGQELGNPWPLAGGLTALCMTTLMGGALFIVASLQPQPVKPVTNYAVFKAPDNAFACQYPANWKKTERSANAVASGGYFKEGNASISVEADLAGSLMTDIPAIPGGMMEEIPNVPGASELNEQIRQAKRSPVERAHADQVKRLEKEMGGYEEEEPKPIQTRMGEGRIAMFTATGDMFGGEIKGYHATVLSSERAITIVCKCPAANWNTLKAPFEKVIQSVGPAQ
jgi:hypothetical protein